ncbi:MAG: hypothetical protein AB1502_19375, partial [Thermodesulfobacteriota bacterium]
MQNSVRGCLEIASAGSVSLAMTTPFCGFRSIEMADILHLDSPAKVNLRLEILKKREDGYHELRTILQKITL